jgi:O-methyltransferase
MISKLLRDSGFKDTFHIFDSFEGGLSEKVEQDKNARFSMSEKEIGKEKAQFASTEEEVKSALSAFPFVKLYKGWIPERFSEVANTTFAFVHIDVDLYQPTFDSLNFFYPRLSKGGCIVVDDYGLSQFPGCQRATQEFLAKNSPQFSHVGQLGAFFLIK